MGNSESGETGPDPRLVEELIVFLEREQRKNEKLPLFDCDDGAAGLDGSLETGEQREFQQLQDLLSQVHANYPDLLLGKAGDNVGPLKLPPDLLADVEAELSTAFPTGAADCTEAEREEIHKLSAMLAELQSFSEPIRPWKGGWILEPSDVDKTFLTSLLGSPVETFQIEEEYSRRPAYRFFAVHAKLGGDETGRGARKTNSQGRSILLQVPNRKFRETTMASQLTREFHREVTFLRDYQDEIPLKVPAIVGVWDDGQGIDGTENFLIATLDVVDRASAAQGSLSPSRISQSQVSPEITTSSMNQTATGLQSDVQVNSSTPNADGSSSSSSKNSSSSDNNNHGRGSESKLHPTLNDMENFRQVLRDLAQFHGYFFNHAMVKDVEELRKTQNEFCLDASLLSPAWENFKRLHIIPSTNSHGTGRRDLKPILDAVFGSQGPAICVALRNLLHSRPVTLIHGNLSPWNITVRAAPRTIVAETPKDDAAKTKSTGTRTSSAVARARQRRLERERLAREAEEKKQQVEKAAQEGFLEEPSQIYYHNSGTWACGSPMQDLASVFFGFTSATELFEPGSPRNVFLLLEEYHIMLAGLQPVLSRMYPLQTCLSDFNVACLLRWVQHVVENFGPSAQADFNRTAMNDEEIEIFSKNGLAALQQLHPGQVVENALEKIALEEQQRVDEAAAAAVAKPAVQNEMEPRQTKGGKKKQDRKSKRSSNDVHNNGEDVDSKYAERFQNAKPTHQLPSAVLVKEGRRQGASELWARSEAALN